MNLINEYKKNETTLKKRKLVYKYLNKYGFCPICYTNLCIAKQNEICNNVARDGKACDKCQRDIIDKYAVEIYNNIIVKSNDFKYFVKLYENNI